MQRRPRRAAVGAVASPHWAATEVGREVLATGGNAVDACAAMNAMLAVVYPHMCGIGGDLFLLHWDAHSGAVHCLNGSGPAPQLATIEAFRERGREAVPVRGPLTATVPGAVGAWDVALRRFGSRPLASLLEPAIGAADSGVVITERLAACLQDSSLDVANDPVLRRCFLDGKGSPLKAGDSFRQPELALTLQRISAAGPSDFYGGELGEEIGRACEQADGFLRAEDLKQYRPQWVRPLSVPYRGLQVFTSPPNSQGITALMMLNALVDTGADKLMPGSPKFVEAFISAKRKAFVERDRHVSDPAFIDIPIGDLLSGHRRPLAAASVSELPRTPIGGDTVYVCAVDRDGNACSAIQSIYYAFGACFVAGDTGILLHNRGHYFSLDDAHPNRLEPGKRTLHTLMPCIALDGGRPRLVFGAMGADGQPQANVQVIQQVVCGATADEAVAAPRVLHGRFALEDDEDTLHVESDLGDDAIAALEARHPRLEATPPRDQRMGHAQAIELNSEGPASAGSDPRSDGSAEVIW